MTLALAASSGSTVVKTDANTEDYARRLNKYKAGQSPAVLRPQRTRTFQPGLSWLGDDEFESTGLAYKLARHHLQRAAATARKPPGSDSIRDTTSQMNSGFRPSAWGNDQKMRTRARASDDARENFSQPQREIAQNRRPRRADSLKTNSLKTGSLKTESPRTVNLEVAKTTAASHQTLKPSPKPQMPTHIDFGSTDFTSLFGTSSLSNVPSSTRTKTTATDAVSRRVQLTLEHYGGDYSKLVPDSLATGRGDPLVYAASTVARRRDLGPNRRNTALEIVRGMIERSPSSQPTL